MNSNIQLKIRNLPKALGELTHSNQFLKMAFFYSMAVCLLSIATTAYLAVKPPKVIALAPDGSAYATVKMPQPQDEIKEAISRYVEKRYQWEPKTVDKRLAEAQIFVSPSVRGVFMSAARQIIKFSTDRNVSQKVYPQDFKVDLANQTVGLRGDRVTTIQGLKAAGDLKLELTFESGKRTSDNPWGIYITKEREE